MEKGLVSSSVGSTNYCLTKVLLNAGLIQSEIFAFYLDSSQASSTLEIGGYTTTNFRNGESLVYISLNNYYNYWAGDIEGFRVGTSNTFIDGTVSAYASTNTAIFDSGTVTLRCPSSLFPLITSLIFKGKKHRTIKTRSIEVAVSSDCDTTAYESFFLYS